ncbi:uncharacterized protein LOC116124745 [Pistacia vera]|uniref:uncharacterized protein LOC116124745 n=1 Tax=Pistacia vera TaxID=55513 RepID=UPI0012638ECB|nr:uncharacterized protein LOC116124745 [Pistacia vera]
MDFGSNSYRLKSLKLQQTTTSLRTKESPVKMERKPIWLCTLATQLCLFSALYIALNMGHPQTSIYRERDQFYFISVSGGFRPLQLQTLLLKKMDLVAKSYKVRFVINTSELGEDDPLKQNATQLFPSLRVPWYTTRVSEEKEVGCFREQIKLPHGETLEIVGVDTGSLQETMLSRFSNGTGDNQLSSLTRTLEATNGHWCIVVGFHPLVICEENKEEIKAKKIYEPLHRIFMKLGVNAYLSKHGCAEFARQDSVAYIENPDLIESVNGRGMVDGFLLHRVSSLEIVTYFVTSAGEVVYRTVIQQRGREAM